MGFIGLGHMGAEVAKHLLSLKHELLVWNRSREKADEMGSAGAKVAGSPEQLMASDVVFSMLTDDSAIENTLIRPGVFEKAKAGIIHVNLSTISPRFAKTLAAFHGERKQKYISAPVLGRPEAAKAAKLIVVAAGDLDAMDIVQPLLDSFSQKTWVLGEQAEKANVVKLANNLMLATAIESMSEASALVGGYGLKAHQLLEITNSSTFACPAYQIYGKAIADEAFEPGGFSVSLGAKDVRLGLAAAEEVNVPMPLSSVVRDRLLEAKAMVGDQKDWAVLGLVARMRAGLQI